MTKTKALRFYTDILGFAKKTEIPLGHHRWLTVVSLDEPNGTELALEPDDHPAAKPFKAALVGDGIPFTSFAVDDVQKPRDHRRLRRHLREPDSDRAATLSPRPHFGLASRRPAAANPGAARMISPRPRSTSRSCVAPATVTCLPWRCLR